jgi:hypothetical protein
MRKRKKRIGAFLISLALLGLFSYLIINFPPTYHVSIGNLLFPILPIFFLLTFAFLYFFFSALLSKRRGILIALFANIFLLLHLNHLTHPLFLILLVIIFGGLELLFIKKK